MLDAAFEVFAEQGFGRSTIEQVCERAGFTRGAFYSNFASLDELFLAMWEQKSAELLEGLRELVAANPPAGRSWRDGVELVLAAVPVNDEWYRITAEFTAHALRHPALRSVMARREHAIIATLMPILDDLLRSAGRFAPDPEALGNALVAVHDGTLVQCLIEPDSADVRRKRLDLFLAVVESYTETVHSRGDAR